MNYILGDVLNAEAFVKMDDGQLVHYFSAKTMTESTINVSVSAEEIRGGWGNQLLGKIFHDTNFGVNLTEAMFSMNYLAAQIGGEVKKDGSAKLLKSVDGTYAGDGKISFIPEGTPISMFSDALGFCSEASDKIIVWAKDCNGTVASFEASKKADATNTYEGKIINGNASAFRVGNVCVSYAVSKNAAEQLIIKAAFEPKEFSLYLYGKLFTGDSCSKSKTGRVGTITIEIPRFQLDGTVDLSFNPSSNASVTLNGTALAYGCDCGEKGKEYAKISTVLDSAVDASAYAKYTGIALLNKDSLAVGDPVIIYLTGNNITPVQYTGDFEAKVGGANALDENGLIKTAGEMTVSVKLPGQVTPLTATATVVGK